MDDKDDILNLLTETANEDAESNFKRDEEINEKIKNEQLLSLKEDRKDKVHNRNLRKELSGKVFQLVSFSLFGVFLLLLFTGMPNKFYLSDNVLITILGSTTIDIIGVLVIVITYYFSVKRK